jgi:Glycosyltransferase family 87
MTENSPVKTSNIRAQVILMMLINGLLMAFMIWFTLQVVVSVRGLRFDFYPHWVAAQAFWRGQMPYDAEVTAEIQRGMFGEVLPPDFDQQNSAYPAYTSLLLAPIMLLPASIAIALWAALQFFSIVWTIGIWIFILKWRPPPWLLGILTLGFLLVFRHSINLFVLAQFTGTILLMVSLAVWLLLNGHDRWAGVVLACSTIPPTIAAPLSLALLMAYALRGRVQGLVAFIITIAVLIAITTAQIGWWIPNFVDILRKYAQYARPIWAVNLIENPVLRILFVGGVVAVCFWAFLNFWRQPNREQQIDLSMTLMIVAVLLIPQTGSYYMVLLIPPILVCIYKGQVLREKWLVWLACTLAIISPWFYWWLGGEESPLEALLLPLYVGLIWGGVYFRYRASAAR